MNQRRGCPDPCETFCTEGCPTISNPPHSWQARAETAEAEVRRLTAEVERLQTGDAERALAEALAREAILQYRLQEWINATTDDDGEIDAHGYAALMEGLHNRTVEMLASPSPTAALLLRVVEAADVYGGRGSLISRSLEEQISYQDAIDDQRDALFAAVDALRADPAGQMFLAHKD